MKQLLSLLTLMPLFLFGCANTKTVLIEKPRASPDTFGQDTECSSTVLNTNESIMNPCTDTNDVINTNVIVSNGIMSTPNPFETPTPSPVRVTMPSDLAYGTPVPGKPGFVISPHAPTSGYVDVRGFPPGTEVKDPYSGKIFLVP